MGPASSSVPCGGCTLCCRQQKVFLLPGDDAVGLGAVSDRRVDGKVPMRLPRTPDGDCAYLGETGCTIYDRRPKVCREFDCRGHYHLPAAERRRREAMFGPHDLAIVRRGRDLVERGR